MFKVKAKHEQKHFPKGSNDAQLISCHLTSIRKNIEKSIHYVSNDVISITNNEIALNYFQLCL